MGPSPCHECGNDADGRRSSPRRSGACNGDRRSCCQPPPDHLADAPENHVQLIHQWVSRFRGCRPNRRTVSGKAFKRFKAEIRRRTRRTRGVSLPRVVRGVRQYLDGWFAYFDYAEAPSAVQGAGLEGPAVSSLLSLEAMGATPIPRAGEPWGKRGSGLEHRQVGRWSLAVESEPSFDLCLAGRVFRRARRATVVSAPASLTDSAEPPDM